MCASHFGGDVRAATCAPGVSADRLRPETEGTQCGAATRGIERDVRMEEKRYIVLGDIQVAFVDLRGVWQGIEVFKRRTCRIMHDGTIVSKADARDRSEGFAGGKFSQGVINFLAYDKINR